MNFTLHQLQVFSKVVEMQSITKASVALHLTQPAVSIQLKNFQDQFPIPLTEVVGRKLYITDFGQEIAQASKKILEELETINYKTHAFQGELAGRLRFSIVSTGKYVMPYFLSDFITNHPGVELTMDVTNKARVLETLESNSTDFALVSVLPDTLKINRVELMENRLFYVVSSSFILPNDCSERGLIESVPLIFREAGSATRMAMEFYISSYGYRVNQKLELTSNEAVKQAVIAGLGASIMPLIGIKNAVANGDVKIIPLSGLPIKTNWNLIWLAAKNLSPVATAYLSYIEKNKDKIMSQHFKWYSAF